MSTVFLSITPMIHAQEIEEEPVTCYLDASCNLRNNPIGAFLKPLSHAFTVEIEGQQIDLSILVIWGTILFVVWLRSHNMMLVAVLGVFLTISLQTVLPETAVKTGYVLLAFSIGVILFKLFTKKSA